MKISKKIKESKSYAIGYEEGKKDTIKHILNFVDKESKFIVGIGTDMLLDRIVKEVRKIEEKIKWKSIGD